MSQPNAGAAPTLPGRGVGRPATLVRRAAAVICRLTADRRCPHVRSGGHRWNTRGCAKYEEMDVTCPGSPRIRRRNSLRLQSAFFEEKGKCEDGGNPTSVPQKGWRGLCGSRHLSVEESLWYISLFVSIFDRFCFVYLHLWVRDGKICYLGSREMHNGEWRGSSMFPVGFPIGFFFLFLYATYLFLLLIFKFCLLFLCVFFFYFGEKCIFSRL